MELEDGNNFVYRPRMYKALYALFYATEGFAITGILLFLPVYMSDQLLFDEMLIGVLLAIGAVPGYLKVVYGFASDSKSLGRFGYRRGYVLISIPLIIGGWLILPLATEAILFTTVVFITTLGFYLSDTAVDAWAVDVTPESDRGSMMGIGWGAQGIASVFGVLVITLMTPSVGYPAAFLLLGVTAGIGALIWLIVAREKPVENRKTVTEALSVIREELNQSYLWLAFLAYIGGGFIFGVGTNFISLFYTDVVGVDSTESAIFVLIWSIFFFIGGIIGGIAYDRFKDYRTGVMVIAPIYAIALFLMGFNSAGNLMMAYATTILFGIGSGMTTAAMMGFAMHITPPAIAGTMFAVFTSLVNVGQNGIGYIFLGYTVPAYGYTFAFAVGALIAIPVIMLAKYIVPPWKKETDITQKSFE